MDDFQHRFDCLPPELRNMILDFTFCTGPIVQHITKDYESPSAFSVSRSARAKFAKSHFELNVFKASNQGLLRKWLLSLDQEDRMRIATIHFSLTHSPKLAEKTEQNQNTQHPSKKTARDSKRQRPREGADHNSSRQKRADARVFYIRSYLGKRKVKLAKTVVNVNVQFDGMKEEVWTCMPEMTFKAWKTRREMMAGRAFEIDSVPDSSVLMTASSTAGTSNT